MQTQHGANAEAEILGPERSFRASVLVDWNMNGLYDHGLADISPYVSTVTTDRALEGSAPEEVLLIEGSSSAEMTIVMGGEYAGLNLTSVFSPYNTLSPFYGKVTVGSEIKYSLIVDSPLGQFDYPQFIGVVRNITPNRADGTVEITALDRAELMRRPIQLPPFAMSEEHVSYGELDSQLVRSEWVIDNCCRLSDTSVSPKRPVTREELGLAPGALDGVQLWVSGNGAYLPTVGYLDNPNADTFPNPGTAMYAQNGPLNALAPAGTPRPLGLAGLGLPLQQTYYKPNEKGILRYWVADADQLDAASNHIIGFTINTNGPNATAVQTIGLFTALQIMTGMGGEIVVQIQNGQVWSERRRFNNGSQSVDAVSAKVNIPTGQDHVDVLVQWDSTRCFVRAGTNTNGNFPVTGTPFTAGSDVSIEQIKGRVTIGQGINFSDVFYAVKSGSNLAKDRTDLAWRTPKYLAVLDQGLNQFSYIPSAKRQEAWTVVKDVASAEFGSVFWDETGVFRFWNWQTLLSKRNTTVRTFSLDDVSDLKLTNTLDSIRNIFTVSTKKKRAAGIVKLYEAADISEFYLPNQTEKRFRIWLDDVVSPLTFKMTRYAGGARAYGLPVFDDNISHGYVVQYETSSGWTERDEFPSLEIYVYFTSQGYLTVRIKNETGYSIRLAKGLVGDSASAAFRFGGTKIFESPDLDILYENSDSITKYGPRSLELSGDWYQDSLSVTNMFDVLLPRTGEPVPTTDAITVAGDPRIQLGDVIKVSDPEGFGVMPLQIYGVRRVFDLDDGLTDTYTVEVVPPDPPAPDPGDPQPVVTRYNLCPCPSSGKDSSGYYGGSGRVTGVTSMPRTTGYQINGTGSVICPKGNVKVGQSYRYSAYLKGTGGASSGTANIDFYSNNGYMSSSPSVSWSVTSGGVVRIDSGTVVAPIGAAKALLVINGIDNASVVTGVLYEQATTLGSYIDGESTGGAWDGAQYNSTSRVTA